MDSQIGAFHSHCVSCIKVAKCTKKPQEGVSCLLLNCPLKCGARHHGCKQEEHLLLCPNVKEPCINAAYGCPHEIPRKNRGTHLETCPASVIPCTAEWNRWPLCSKERQVYIPFTQVNPQLRNEQLDIALALRDQGMLDHWMELPRKIQRLMRCSLTPRHPPIPLVSTLWNPVTKRKLKSFSSDDGLLNQSLESTPRQSAERSDNSLLSMTSTDDESPWGRRRKPPGLLQSVCSQLFNKTQQTQAVRQSLPMEMTKADQQIEDDTLSDISDGLEDRSDIEPAFHQEDEQVVPVFQPSSPNPPAPPVLPLLAVLGLDLSIECIPRYQSKPKSMYTFVCAQDFRRDEYPWHYRNWHSEIHGGLDGWLEQRCPLARYGCPYARRRLNPVGCGSRLVYSSTIESFGVKNTSDLFQRGCNENLSLCDLPFEVLRSIARYLDSFSLCHLSLTCRLLRDVGRSLVHGRGLVIVQWEKSAYGWSISHKKWMFSTSFSPVERWAFEDGEHMANHMKTCRYYIKSDLSRLPERIKLPGCDPELFRD